MVCAGDHLGRGWAGRAGRGGDAGPSGFYDLTDAMFSVRAITDSAGLLHTRLDYTPYGVAMHGLAPDANGDGSVNTADLGVVSANYNGGNELQPGDTGYDPDAFLDGSDTIVLSDYTGRYSPYVSGGSGPTFNAGWIDNPGDANGPDNSVGYDGYWFDLAGATEATSSGLYMVRHRVYDPRLGRWLERDPSEYADGMSLYGFVDSDPILHVDTFGLARHAFGYEHRFAIGAVGLAAYIRVSGEKDDNCLYAELAGGLEWNWKNVPGMPFVSKLAKMGGFTAEAYARFLVGANVGLCYDNCGACVNSEICGIFEVGVNFYTGKSVRSPKPVKGLPGRPYMRNRRGGGFQASGSICINLCSGDVTFQARVTGYIEANLGFWRRNRSYSYSFSKQFSKCRIGRVEGLAVLKHAVAPCCPSEYVPSCV